MDPFTISTACIGVATGIATLSAQIFNFASNVRDSRKDLDAVSRELSSLQMCLESLRNDAVTITYPPRIKQNIYDILKNCESKVTDMTTLLLKVDSKNIGRSLQWSAVYRDQVNAMRAGIEAYKSSLEIALELGSTLLITAVQETTNATQTDVTLIRRDVARISRLVNDTRTLRSHFHRLEEQGINISVPLQRFLDETESYAESVRDPDNVDNVSDAWWEAETITTERTHGIRDSFQTTTNDSSPADVNIRRRPVPSGLRSVPLNQVQDVPDYVSGKFAAFVYVVPLNHTKIAEHLAHRSALDDRSKTLLDAEMLTAVTDTSRQPFVMIKTLVEHGADVTSALREELRTGLAVRHGVVFHLISMGATVDLNSEIYHHHNYADILRFLIHQKKCNLESVNNPGDKNVLHNALRQNKDVKPHFSTEAIKILCEHGADLNRGDDHGETPLHAALHLANDHGLHEVMEIIRVLLEWGAGPLVLSSTEPRYRVGMEGRFRPNARASVLEVASVYRGARADELQRYSNSEFSSDHWHQNYQRWCECEKLLKYYASHQIEPKYSYDPARPCSCRFSPAPEPASNPHISGALRRQDRHSARKSSFLGRLLGSKSKQAR